MDATAGPDQVRHQGAMERRRAGAETSAVSPKTQNSTVGRPRTDSNRDGRAIPGKWKELADDDIVPRLDDNGRPEQ